MCAPFENHDIFDAREMNIRFVGNVHCGLLSARNKKDANDFMEIQLKLMTKSGTLFLKHIRTLFAQVTVCARGRETRFSWLQLFTCFIIVHQILWDRH